MEEIVKQFIEFITTFVESNNILVSLFFGMFSIVLESIIPILPLALFIAINMIAFGNIIGFVLSWISTTIGCTLSFFLCRKFRNFMEKKIKKEHKILNFIGKIDDIKFSNLVLILAMPFTPAFSINVAAGLSKMRYKKYLMALLISKTFIIYFWGYVGSTFLENITNPIMLLRLAIIILILSIISKKFMKEFNL